MQLLKANRSPLSLVAASAFALGLAAGPALADDSDVAPGVKVSYADLDLSKQAGAEALYGRIQAAARSVCERADGRDIDRFTLYRQCYTESIEAALKEVDVKSLYAVHNRKVRAPAS